MKVELSLTVDGKSIEVREEARMQVGSLAIQVYNHPKEILTMLQDAGDNDSETNPLIGFNGTENIVNGINYLAQIDNEQCRDNSEFFNIREVYCFDAEKYSYSMVQYITKDLANKLLYLDENNVIRFESYGEFKSNLMDKYGDAGIMGVWNDYITLFFK